MFAGQTLAQIADAIAQDANLVPAAQAELQARVARGGKSAKNAQKALERMAAGGDVRIPARPEKAPAAPKAPKAPAGSKNPNSGIIAQNARSRGVVSEKDAFALVAAVGRSAGYSIPRWVSAGAKGRTIAAKA